MLVEIVLVFLLFLLSPLNIFSQDLYYKTINDTLQLKLDIVEPTLKLENGKSHACIIFLSGGGWEDFTWTQFSLLANAMADRGLVSIIVEYRTSNNFPNSTPFDALEDVEDAIKFIREKSEKLNINREQIIACGISAGGHLAIMSSLHDRKNVKQTDLFKPNYIVAISPVLRNDDKGYAYEKIGENFNWFSPYNVYKESNKKLPPTLIISGEDDHLIKFKDLIDFKSFSLNKGDSISLFKVSLSGHSLVNYYKSIFIQIYPLIINFVRYNNIPIVKILYDLNNKDFNLENTNKKQN